MMSEFASHCCQKVWYSYNEYTTLWSHMPINTFQLRYSVRLFIPSYASVEGLLKCTT